MSIYNFQYFLLLLHYISETKFVLLLHYNYFKTLVTCYFGDFNFDYKTYINQFNPIHFGHLRIADLQAHNASHRDALRACRSAIFNRFCKHFVNIFVNILNVPFENGTFCDMSTFTCSTLSTFWCWYFCTFTQVHFQFPYFYVWQCSSKLQYWYFYLSKTVLFFPHTTG